MPASSIYIAATGGRHRQVDDRAGDPAPAGRHGGQGRCVPADHASRTARTATTSWICCWRTTTAGLPYERCIGVTYQQLHADRDAAIDDIVERYHAMAAECDAVVIVGSDYTDVASPAELSVNARIAANLGAPVVLAVRAKGRTAEQVAHVVEVCLAELTAQHAHTAAVVANRCEPAQLTAVAEALRPLGPRTYVLPDEPLLVAPTVADLQTAVNGTLVSGDTALMGREAMGVVVAGMTADHVLERLREGVAVITPGDRSDVVLAVASAHAAEGFPSLSCIILNGGFELHPVDRGAGGRAAAAAADHRHHAGHLRDRQRGGVDAGPGHRDVAAQDRHRAAADGAPRRSSRTCWRSWRFRSRR